MPVKKTMFDVIIVGGGPAGLTCALVLGRCGRKVAVFDTGKQRNSVSPAMHGFPSRDGTDPAVFLGEIRRELKTYGIGVAMREITHVKRLSGGFTVSDKLGRAYQSRLLLLATGLRDTLPLIPGIGKFYGKGVYHCPYCDGWEHCNKPWIVWAVSAKAAVEVCLRLRSWTSDVTLLAACCPRMRKTDVETLKKNGVKITYRAISRLYGKEKLEGAELDDGTKLDCAALFFSNRATQHTELAKQLGCKFNKQGQVRADRLQQTCVSGLYVAGDMARDMELVVIAAAEGAKAAVAMNIQLNRRERKK